MSAGKGICVAMDCIVAIELKKISKLLKKQYIQYGKESEFSPLLAVTASFNCGGFGVRFVGQDMSVPMEGAVLIELKK